MIDVDIETFTQMVARAVDELPPQYADQIANLEFAVEEVARPGDYSPLHDLAPGATLLGVYRGVPLTRRGRGYNMMLPDQIVIFRQPLLRLSRTVEELEERVGRVVRHEIAHYFGISDDRLREIGAY